MSQSAHELATGIFDSSIGEHFGQIQDIGYMVTVTLSVLAGALRKLPQITTTITTTTATAT